MKHHATNFGLFALLIALLIAPLAGFYMFNYQPITESNYIVPEYVPINVIGGSEVLSDVDERVAETSVDAIIESTMEFTEFDPINYVPAN